MTQEALYLIPPVHVFTEGGVPPYRPDLHELASNVVVRLCALDEPLCVVETFFSNVPGVADHMYAQYGIVYHMDHVVKWAEMHDATQAERAAGAIVLLPPHEGFDHGLRLPVQTVVLNVFRK